MRKKLSFEACDLFPGQVFHSLSKPVLHVGIQGIAMTEKNPKIKAASFYHKLSPNVKPSSAFPCQCTKNNSLKPISVDTAFGVATAKIDSQVFH